MRLTVFSFFSLCSFIWARDEQPNILYIFTDDQSVRSVSAYEKARSWVSTPHIDRLAKSGVASPSATPAHGANLPVPPH